ncbi:MAG TPA: GvpL/GvpF family gas vesicle protein [Blastocatellia bacterium]|nr:GvpL/GvpF family gas vesicle protein [Blastocatellia bacterium]
MKLYVYCLSDDLSAGAVEGVSGIGGARVGLYCCGAIKAVISEAGGERALLTRENVLAHDGVIRHALRETTPLPFRFGTIVTASELESYVEARRSSIESLLDRVRGAVEMGVKIIWDKEAARSAAEAQPCDEADGAGPGRAFLLAKRREMEAAEEIEKRAKDIAGWMENRLNSLVRETFVSIRPADALVIVAAHLVERSRIEQYRARLKSMRQERSDLRFLTSGAWPPYSFAHIRA